MTPSSFAPFRADPSPGKKKMSSIQPRWFENKNHSIKKFINFLTSPPPNLKVKDGLLHLLYRAEDTVGTHFGTSRIGLAISTDGLTFTRLTTPIFYPADDAALPAEWDGGCEDPRIVESPTGTYFMTYTAYNGDMARLFVASSPDLLTWTKHGPAFGPQYVNMSSKAGAIVTRLVGERFVAERINGFYWMYFGDTNAFIATSSDLISWSPLTSPDGDPDKYNLTMVLRPRPGYFDSRLNEPGPQAVIRDGVDGILLIYNGMNYNETMGGDPNIPEDTYSAGQALFNASNPIQLISRTEEYFMTPDKPYEEVGQVGNVVFLEGLVRYKGAWFLYYGTADSKIAVAKTDA